MTREKRVLLSGGAAVMTVLATWIIIAKVSQDDDMARAGDSEHATVGIAPSANAQTIRDVTVTPRSGTSPSAATLMPTLALARTTPADEEEAAAPDPVAGVSIARQRFQRGGLGSQALVSFTIRNRNDYPVTGIEMRCAFKSRDGRYATERRHVVLDTIGTKSRKRFSRELVGFVNVRMSRAKCALVTASRA